jgi:3'-phosphoadenosine 5'-phosphosulfate sulfotransferase (PAPS reductase)/FAD synthetase
MGIIKCLVPISGGKDSQATLKLALQRYAREDIRGLFCDTGFEHPLTYIHVAKMGEMYGIEIDYVCAGDVLSKSVDRGRFPTAMSRHCTLYLKIRPTKTYCRELAKKQGCGFEVWYGMRSGESPQRETRYSGKVSDELYAPHEVMPSAYPKYLAKMGVMFRLAILEWSKVDVIEFVGWENLNPLYREGFDRVGCFPCLASGDKWKQKAFEYDDFGRSQHRQVILISKQIGKNIFTSKVGQLAAGENPGCSICSI